LVSDTVGFIKKLPHDLVASFKSTLDEALEASLLLQLVDASDPEWKNQLTVTRNVLSEIGADSVPVRLVFNKVDKIPRETAEALRAEFPDAWHISARDASDVRRVREAIVASFEARYVLTEIVVPYSSQRLVSEMHDSGRVESTEYTDAGVVVRWHTDADTLARMRARLDRP
jgi:GTP-binding protein HflX